MATDSPTKPTRTDTIALGAPRTKPLSVLVLRRLHCNGLIANGYCPYDRTQLTQIPPKSFVASWHETDLTRCLLFGRYRGISGSNTDIVKLSRMTHKRHPPALLCCNSEGGFSPFRKANLGRVRWPIAGRPRVPQTSRRVRGNVNRRTNLFLGSWRERNAAKEETRCPSRSV
jgi:hypothetical protein